MVSNNGKHFLNVWFYKGNLLHLPIKTYPAQSLSRWCLFFSAFGDKFTYHCWGHRKATGWPLTGSSGIELNVPAHWQFTFFLLIRVKLNAGQVYDLFTILMFSTALYK